MKDVPCAYCDTSVLSTAFVLCGQCEVPVHRDCWAEGGKCPTYACGATQTLDPAVALFRRESTVPMTQAPAPMTQPVPAAHTAPVPHTEYTAHTAPTTPAHESDSLPGIVTQALGVIESVFQALVGGERKPRPVPVPMLPAERDREIAAIEERLHRERMTRWIHNTVIVAWVLMMPMMFKLISKNFVFPAVAILVALVGWPGFKRGMTRRERKTLSARLDRLQLEAASGRAE